MPWPMALYHFISLVGVILAEAQIASSLVLVPDLSPRLTNVAWTAAIALKASAASLAPATLTGSFFGPTMMKSLYITSKRSLASPSATNLSSCARACTSSTSASPLRPISIAWPVPTATTFTLTLLAFSNTGRMKVSRPESAVVGGVASGGSPGCLTTGAKVAVAVVAVGAATVGAGAGLQPAKVSWSSRETRQIKGGAGFIRTIRTSSHRCGQYVWIGHIHRACLLYTSEAA